MKLHRTLLSAILLTCLCLPPGISQAAWLPLIPSAATITSKTAKTTLVGTEEVPLNDSGTDKKATIAVVWTSMIVKDGLTASGSGANDYSGSTGGFKTSTGANVFGGSSHTFASGITPATNDGGALGSSSLMWSDLFLASGGVININNGNWVATHTSGILTVGTGDLRVTTAGTNTASVVTVGGTQTLTAKTLTSPVINAATIGTSLVPTSDDGAALGDTTHNFSDLFLASGGVINIANGNWVATHTSAILTVGTGDLRVTTAGTNTASVVTVGGAQTLTSKVLTAPTITTGITPTSNDGAALGSSSLQFSDLFLANGAVINISNGDWVATHTAGIVTVGTGDLRVTTAGTNTASVVTVGGTQTLTAKTLTSPTLTTPAIGVATGTSVAVTGLLSSSSSSAGIGYATGAGNVVTQATSKSTGATINAVTGAITMNNESLADATNVSFTVTNSSVAALDAVIVHHASAGTAGAYQVSVNAVGAGSFKITVRNVSGGALGEAIVLRFAVIKGVSS